MKRMNSIFLNKLIISLITGILLFSLSSPAFCNLQAKERTRLRSYFFIHSNGDRQISVLLTSGRGRNMRNVSDASIELSIDLGDSALFLTDLITDENGSADLFIESDYNLPVDEEGITTILAEYIGNDSLRAASSDIEIKDVFLEISFDVEDSLKLLTVLANELDAAGERIPVEGLDIIIGIDRLYSILPIDAIETDENGIGTLEFPNDIPGDSIGMILIVATIDEHDYFGTVTKIEPIDWGIPVSYELKPLPRQLFTDEAPLWMILAVFIVLVGAWYHFFLSISKLYKLRNAAKHE